MQKILAGQARGRSLKQLPKGTPVRPILARIKKSVFDIIRFRLPGIRFLDLYAGTGSVGMEALSQGAAQCVFVEMDSLCINHLQKNLEILKFDQQSIIVRSDVLKDLSPTGGNFKIIFMGPPYVDREKKMLALTEPTLENIAKYNLLAPQGLIVAQHHKKEPVGEKVGPFVRTRQKEYGDTVVSFFATEGTPQ